MLSATLLIPQHGQSRLTRTAIQSIRRHDPTPWPILVVDDGSPDDSPDQIARLGDPDLTLLRRPRRGVTAAWNHAARHATTPVLVFLNNDIEARGPFVEPLIAPLLPPGCGNPRPIAPISTHPHRPLLTGIRLRHETALPSSILNRLPARRFLEGWCFALRRDLLEQAGGFDESLPLYWSDTDLQCRLLAHNAPFRAPASLLHAIPALPVRHLNHRTAHALPDRQFQWRRDRAAFIRKWRVASGE